jgi:hypothetical protein
MIRFRNRPKRKTLKTEKNYNASDDKSSLILDT